MAGYALGIDLGTTYSAAAVHRDGQAQIVSLGTRSAAIPSVVYLNDDHTVVTGEAADRRGVTRADRVARGFKRRLGDTTPILLGGAPHSAESLMAKMLRAIADKVAELEGGPAEHVAISHPANWGPFKQDLLGQAIRLAELTGATVLTEPEAAAIHYATSEHLPVGEIVAVYDLGGGTFDAAILRRTDAGFEILGEPEGIQHLGGIDFDAAVFNHVRDALGGRIEELDTEDQAAVASAARLREECIDAKEALSSDPEVGIPVVLPNVVTEVRLTRPELERMIRPALSDTIASLQRAMQSAKVTPAQVSRVLLIGGSSRIPLVAELVSGAIGRPIAIDAHPKFAVALGAAVAAAAAGAESTMSAVVETTPVAEVAELAELPEAEASPAPPPFAPPPPQSPPPPSPPRAEQPRQSKQPKRRRTIFVGAAVVIALLAGGGAVLLSRNDGARTCSQLTAAELAKATGFEATPFKSSTSALCVYSAGAQLVFVRPPTSEECDEGTRRAVGGRRAAVCVFTSLSTGSGLSDVNLYFTRHGQDLHAQITAEQSAGAPAWVTAFDNLAQAIADPA